MSVTGEWLFTQEVVFSPVLTTFTVTTCVYIEAEVSQAVKVVTFSSSQPLADHPLRRTICLARTMGASQTAVRTVHGPAAFLQRYGTS